MLLSEFVDEYFVDVRLEPNTKIGYRAAVNLIDRWHGKPVALRDIDDRFLSRWIADYEASGVSPFSVKSRRGTLIALLTAANDAGLSDYRPNSRRIRRPRAGETVKDIWSIDEAGLLIAAASKCPGRFKRTCIPRNWYFQALFSVAWDSGLRLGDLLRIECEWVKTSRTFSIVQHKPKRAKIVTLNESTQKLCLMTFDRFCSSRQYLFEPWRVGQERSRARGVSDYAKKIMVQAGLTCSDGVFKKLRRSSITYAEAKQPGTGWIHAGHVNHDVTIKHYINSAAAYSNRPPIDPLGRNGNDKATH